ncbi:MAG: GLPGLI family protein [Lacibacter sp.]
MKQVLSSSAFAGKHFAFFLFFAIAHSYSSKAQEKVIKVVYQNYGEENKPLGKLKTSVFISDSISVSLLQLDYYFELGKQMLRTDTNNTGNTGHTSVIVRPEDTLKRYVYKDFKNDRLYFETNRSTIYPVFKTFSDSLHNMQWVLNEKVKKIDSFVCSQATCFFRGRSYTAWYTPEIPVSNGPWKFGGLPGLILEVYDSAKVVYWRVVSVIKEPFVFPPLPQKTNGNFYDYKRDYNALYLKMKKSFESANDQNDPDCKGCTGVKKTIKSNTPEILIDQ